MAKETPAIAAIPAKAQVMQVFTFISDIPPRSRRAGQLSTAQTTELSEKVNCPFKPLNLGVVFIQQQITWEQAFLRSQLGRMFCPPLQTSRPTSLQVLPLCTLHIVLFTSSYILKYISLCLLFHHSLRFPFQRYTLVCACENSTGFRSIDATMKEKDRKRNKSCC